MTTRCYVGVFGSFGWNQMLLVYSSQFRRPKTGQLMDDFLTKFIFIYTAVNHERPSFDHGWPLLATHCPRLYHGLVLSELFIPSKIQNTKIQGLSKIRVFIISAFWSDQEFTGRDRSGPRPSGAWIPGSDINWKTLRYSEFESLR